MFYSKPESGKSVEFRSAESRKAANLSNPVLPESPVRLQDNVSMAWRIRHDTGVTFHGLSADGTYVPPAAGP